MSLQYPRIPHDEKKSTKLTLKQIKEIRSLYPQYNLKDLSEIYEVDQRTIRYWIDPIFRIKEITRNSKRYSDKWKDPEFRKHILKITYNLISNRRKNDYLFKNWQNRIRNKSANEYYSTHTTKVLKSKHKAYQENKQHYQDLRKRYSRAKNLSAFRRFWKRIES